MTILASWVGFREKMKNYPDEHKRTTLENVSIGDIFLDLGLYPMSGINENSSVFIHFRKNDNSEVYEAALRLKNAIEKVRAEELRGSDFLPPEHWLFGEGSITRRFSKNINVVYLVSRKLWRQLRNPYDIKTATLIVGNQVKIDNPADRYKLFCRALGENSKEAEQRFRQKYVLLRIDRIPHYSYPTEKAYIDFHYVAKE